MQLVVLLVSLSYNYRYRYGMALFASDTGKQDTGAVVDCNYKVTFIAVISEMCRAGTGMCGQFSVLLSCT